MQVPPLFGEFMGTLCNDLSYINGSLTYDSKQKCTIIDIGSGYHSYMLDIRKKCKLKVGT